MRREIVTCDRCGRESEGIGEYVVRLPSMYKLGWATEEDYAQFDLCDACALEVGAVLEKGWSITLEQALSAERAASDDACGEAR